MQKMLEPLCWESRSEREENPFAENSSRPLKVTLHSASFVNLTVEEARAVQLIRELSSLPDIDLLETDANATRRFAVTRRSDRDHYDVTRWDGDRWAGSTGVSYPEQHLRRAQALARSPDPTNPDVIAALQDTLIAEAHISLGRDLLITQSPWIHAGEWRNVARRGNPRTVTDAVKVIGLLLRSRRKFVFRTNHVSPFDPGAFSRALYYLVLARHRTPNMWRYNSLCQHFRDTADSHLATMSWSVITRCKHAIQARDLIGESFYAPHDDGSGDDTAYHFDYLTLLLVGALDAQARVAHRAYRLPGSNRVSFKGGAGSGFLNGLRKAGGTALYDLLTTVEVENLMTLLFEIRNTIHEASLSASGHHSTGKGPGWFELDQGDFATRLWTAAFAVGGADDWGLKKLRYQKGVNGPIVEPVQVHPYPYVVQLVRRGLHLVDSIAANTEVERLFEGNPVPEVLNQPPEDERFGREIRERLDLLG